MSGEYYILDTNILFNWLEKMSGQIPEWVEFNPGRYRSYKRRINQCARFCENSHNNIVVPAIVWVELCGAFLQKDIDLKNYELWYRKRKAAIQPLMKHLFSEDSHINFGADPLDTELAINLCSWRFPFELRKRLFNRYRKAKSIKGLDGLDASILGYAWRAAENHPKCAISLVTMDYGLEIVMGGLKKAGRLFGESYPKNLQCLSRL